ncbi:MAG: RagB/SusD family nutrient uptake outer membrane protein [Sphingobacteriales bacterium]|nr:MAG: RagB/SusD family nutrient uptake outer membrane protein [Sphingobacteriales bacterium]
MGSLHSTAHSLHYHESVQALFTRALLHTYLASLFGSVPYITTTDYTVNMNVSRQPATEVYGLAITDLEEAVQLLPEAYISEGRARVNKFAAQAVLARCYLYNGDWAEASNAASAVLNSSLYALENDPAMVFLKNSQETIWHFSINYEGSPTDEALAFTLFTAPPTGTALTESLINAFEPGDQRRTEWVGEVSDGADTWYYPAKYRQATPDAASSEYSVVLRLAEMYLVRAEARAMQGELMGALEDLNAIRARAGLVASTATTQQELLSAILRERRVELFTEYGHRFFDLKRAGLLDAVLGTKPGWSATDALLPAPQNELSVNPNLGPQNTGY